MSESANHKKLVELIIDYIGKEVGDDYICLIESDISDDHPLPQLTEEGFRPDVVFEFNGKMIIGEAKTSDDILREHSLRQYASYLRKCSFYNGSAEFVIAVPWMDYATAYNVVYKISRDFPGKYAIKVLKGIL